MRSLRTTALGAVLVALSGLAAAAAPQCYASYGGTKPFKLYLYFPTVSDASYPNFGGPAVGTPATSPAHAFDLADLPNYAAIGGSATVGTLRDRIYDVVADTYCEFNVEVIETTTAPPATFPNRNTVAVTTDNNTADGLFGLAQAVDTGNATAVDFAYGLRAPSR